MIFVGDMALSGKDLIDTSDLSEKTPFSGQAVIANLEGTVCPEDSVEKYLEKSVLINGKNVLPFFNKMNIKAVSLANNHIFDVPELFQNTQVALSSEGIQYFGAGKNIKEAEKPCAIELEGEKIVFLGFGWDAIQCEKAGRRKPGVNPLTGSHVIKTVRKTVERYPNHKLFVVMHWNYELEIYPQPAERQLAKKCIDLGACAVIGGHSHVVQGIEIYKEAPIVYSLGNWLLPWGHYFAGALKFPENTKMQLAFEYDFEKKNHQCHWFEYNPNAQKINFIESEGLRESKKIRKKTPFCDMSHDEYRKWFKKHRNKRRYLPIFYDIESELLNTLKVEFVKARGKFIDLLLAMNLKKIKNE